MTNKNRIRCLRKLYRLSQEEFAKRYNVAQTAVSNWEVFRNNIDISIAAKIAKDYKVPVEFVYGFEITVTRPIEQWTPDEIEDMNRAGSECRDYFLLKYGKGFFADTYDANNEKEPSVDAGPENGLIICRNGVKENRPMTEEELAVFDAFYNTYMKKK